MVTCTVLFYDPAFPYEGQRPDSTVLEALSAVGLEVHSAETFAEALARPDVNTFVHLHGPYFPKSAWPAILGYLKRGGGLVHVGGAPFKIPVQQQNGQEWQPIGERTAYHQQLRIHEALSVSTASVSSLAANSDIPVLEGLEHLFTIEPTVGLILHVTRHDDQPGQGGSSGPMDAHIYPLLCGMSTDGRSVAAPVVLMEHTKGTFAGGRWLLVNQTVGSTFWTEDGIRALSSFADFVSRGVTELWVKPQFATYLPGERPTLTLQIQHINRTGLGQVVPASDSGRTSTGLWTFRVDVRRAEDSNESGHLWSSAVTLEASGQLNVSTLPLPIEIEPGQYQVICTAQSDAGERRVLHQGFWGRDDGLLQSGTVLTCDRDYFRKDGKPLPIVGMTYMTSDVARKYLQLPNVSVWDRDMAEMKAAGINLIRTGIWTAWRQVMFVDGHASEEALRAIDAFILTAKRHELLVTFTFFAFTPEAWEGVNPYLDPRSREAQKRFILSIVSRHRSTSNVHWDLINEPSLFDPNRIFSGPRTLGDPFEKAAWTAWLRNRHGSIDALQDKWNMTSDELPSFESANLPEQSEINFDVEDMGRLKRGTRWLDYTLFTMDMHNQWAADLRETIQSISPQQLVCVGQDEALGIGPRPSPFFYALAVDYTTVHTWWLNDDLVWDGVFGKVHGKPNLIQETGIMYLETPDNRAKRSEAELRNILERKYAYAFATGGAGAVQWIWNTNVYMDNINESNIGALRADGTQKPEADVSYDFGRFMGQVGHVFEDRALEEVAILFPYSNDFSNRRVAYDATRHAVRVLAYSMNVSVRGVSEYDLAPLQEAPPRLLIVPSPHNITDEAAKAVRDYVVAGGTVLWTGPVGLDDYWHPTTRFGDELGEVALANVLREETVVLAGQSLPVSFSRRRIAELNKEIPEEQRQSLQGGFESNGSAAESTGQGVREVVMGSGMFIWCPLPIELNDRGSTLEAVYGHAMQSAKVANPFIWHAGDSSGVYGRKLAFGKGNLFVFVSEQVGDVEIDVTDVATGKRYAFVLPQERSVLFATDEAGQILASYRDAHISIMG